MDNFLLTSSVEADLPIQGTVVPSQLEFTSTSEQKFDRIHTELLIELVTAASTASFSNSNRRSETRSYSA